MLISGCFNEISYFSPFLKSSNLWIWQWLVKVLGWNWLVSFWGTLYGLWALSIFEIILSSATSGMVTLISLARVSLVSSQGSLFLVWGMFQKINVLLRPLFLISSSSDCNSFRLVVRFVIWLFTSIFYLEVSVWYFLWIVSNQFCVGVGKL